MIKKISITGLVTCILYFISVGTFLITKNELALTVWELMTVFSGPVMLFVLLALCKILDITSIFKSAVIGFMSCASALTAVAHIVNIAVTRRLISEGLNVPDYFKIGFWPSVEMAVDYLAWGFFVGLAFLCVGLASIDKNKLKSIIKATSLVCGILCFVGFFGAVFVNENLWYLATLGYGFGTMVLCIQMLRVKNIA